MPQLSELRDLLFGDAPLQRWAGSGKGEPWASFQQAAAAIDGEDLTRAEQALRKVLAQTGLESGQYLQAWTALREIGVSPPASETPHLYGLILDVPMASQTPLNS